MFSAVKAIDPLATPLQISVAASATGLELSNEIVHIRSFAAIQGRESHTSDTHRSFRHCSSETSVLCCWTLAADSACKTCCWVCSAVASACCSCALVDCSCAPVLPASSVRASYCTLRAYIGSPLKSDYLLQCATPGHQLKGRQLLLFMFVQGHKAVLGGEAQVQEALLWHVACGHSFVQMEH